MPFRWWLCNRHLNKTVAQSRNGFLEAYHEITKMVSLILKGSHFDHKGVGSMFD